MLDPDSRLQVLGPLVNRYTAMLILFGGEDTLCMHVLLSDVSGFSACGFFCFISFLGVCGVFLFVKNKMHLTPNLSGGRGFIKKKILPFLIFGFLGHL